MKLLIAIVNNDDRAVVSSSLTREGFTVTKLYTTGGFLMVGNTTFLIGAEDDTVAKAREIIKEKSRKRTTVTSTTSGFGVFFFVTGCENNVVFFTFIKPRHNLIYFFIRLSVVAIFYALPC